jgi:hypothetical protein
MTATLTEDHVYRYLGPTEVRHDARGADIALATSGGCAANPWLADGFLVAPQPAARAMLLVANVAAARYWTPPNMVAAAIRAADPVITASDAALRLESFSQCCGVYARFDLDRSALDGPVHVQGTTNIDVNPALRSALARIGARDPLHLAVGRDEVTVDTLDGRVIEKRVPLPKRWVRGFAEAAVATCALEPVFGLANAGLRQFLQQLPSGSTRGVSWVVPSGSHARLSTRPSGAGVAVGGVERLRALREIAPFVRSATVFGTRGGSASDTGGCSVWSMSIEGGHVTLALSPEPSRGFSGEGGLLFAALHGLDAKLEAAAAGRLGYDVASSEWFARELPFSRGVLDERGGRLEAARQLVASNAVEVLDGWSDSIVVTSGANEYRVRLVDGSWRCTCPWWGKHRGDRGPCKHILATIIASTQD